MAIEALESQAQALRMLDTMGRADDAVGRAEEAEKDVRILRGIAMTHVPHD